MPPTPFLQTHEVKLPRCLGQQLQGTHTLCSDDPGCPAFASLWIFFFFSFEVSNHLWFFPALNLHAAPLLSHWKQN